MATNQITSTNHRLLSPTNHHHHHHHYAIHLSCHPCPCHPSIMPTYCYVTMHACQLPTNAAVCHPTKPPQQHNHYDISMLPTVTTAYLPACQPSPTTVSPCQLQPATAHCQPNHNHQPPTPLASGFLLRSGGKPDMYHIWFTTGGSKIKRLRS